MSVIQRRVRVEGRVQGVGFRAATRAQALSYTGLRGHVRNVEDGSVEAVFIGESVEVQVLVKWCSKGPAGAEVRSVQITEELPVFTAIGFEILR